MTTQPSAAVIVLAHTSEHLPQVRALLEEYWHSFGFTPCFQDFGTELAGLPGVYTPPDGRLALAWVGDEIAGCVALRRLDERRCEAKRLYVRPQFRGRGLGQQLLAWLLAEARCAGYPEMVCDTMPDTMTGALALYERNGFVPVPPYSAGPTPGAIHLGRQL